MAVILKVTGIRNGKTIMQEQEITNEVIRQLEAENEKLKDGIEKAKADIEAKIIKRPWLNFKGGERDRNEAFLEALEIINKLGE